MEGSAVTYSKSFPTGPDRIELHGKEFLMAAHAGLMRQVENLRKGRRHKHAATEADGWNLHIDGCIGEVIVAKWLDVYWTPGTLGKSDIDRCGIEVRTSRHDNPHLILHDDDLDDQPYVLVWLSGCYGYVCGWMLGKDGKDAKFWKEVLGTKPLRNPAFFVPRNELRQASELRRMVQKHLGRETEDT